MANQNPKIMYGAGLIGFGIQRDIGKTTIYRLRHGNGHYGTILNRLYQDKYDYFVSDPTASHCPAAAKTCFANAITTWQALSSQGKKRYNDWADHIRNLSGFNLFIRRYMKENYP